MNFHGVLCCVELILELWGLDITFALDSQHFEPCRVCWGTHSPLDSEMTAADRGPFPGKKMKTPVFLAQPSCFQTEAPKPKLRTAEGSDVMNGAKTQRRS